MTCKDCNGTGYMSNPARDDEQFNALWNARDTLATYLRRYGFRATTHARSNIRDMMMELANMAEPFEITIKCTCGTTAAEVADTLWTYQEAVEALERD